MTRNQIAYWDLKEKERSNLANEMETKRSNMAREGETARHNLATEGLTSSQVSIQQQTADEQRRSNLANENINVRKLIADNNIKLQQLDEMIRNNKAMEGVAWTNANTNAIRVASQNELDTVNAILAQDRNTRENILNVQETERIKNEAKLLQQQIDFYGQGNAQKWVGSISGILGNIAKILGGK